MDGPPHACLADGRSLFDTFGMDWTLLALGPEPPDVRPFVAAARARGMALTVVPLPAAEMRALYEAPLALIRPDQIVAWRGRSADGAAGIVARVVGG